MRKLLRLEKQHLFSNHYVNDRHKKVDWMIRGAFIVALLIGLFINVTREPMERYWFLEVWNVIFASIFVLGALQAIMEWKYAEHRNAYILTVSQLVFIALLLILLFSTDFFGWFE